MTLAKRTTLIRHLSLDIGYELDIDPAVLGGVILEAIEGAGLIDEMGIVFFESNHGRITIFAQQPTVALATAGEDPPETPYSADAEVFAERNGPDPVLNERQEVPKHCDNCCPDEGCRDCEDSGPNFEQCDTCRDKPNAP